jgi:hypothetical protein
MKHEQMDECGLGVSNDRCTQALIVSGMTNGIILLVLTGLTVSCSSAIPLMAPLLQCMRGCVMGDVSYVSGPSSRWLAGWLKLTCFLLCKFATLGLRQASCRPGQCVPYVPVGKTGQIPPAKDYEEEHINASYTDGQQSQGRTK